MDEPQQVRPGESVQPGQSVQPAGNSTAPVPEDTFQSPFDDGNDYDPDQPEQEQIEPEEAVTWDASEYIHHEKNMVWYAAFIGIVVVLVGFMWLLTRDILSVGISIIMAAAVIIYAGRKPRTLRYVLTTHGLQVGEKEYTLDQFRSFSLMQDSGVPSIVLDPIQRFMPTLSVYFEPKDGDKILEILESFVPREDRPPDTIDRFVRKIRF